MGDILVLFDRLNLSPINTILLVAIGYFIRQAVKGIFCRLDTAEQGLAKVHKRNRRQDIAIRRLEQHLKLEAIEYDDDED